MDKKIFKSLLRIYLKLLAKSAIFIHKPFVIGIAGSTNKVFVKEEIAKVLRENGRSVRADSKSFNTDIGLPLAILGLDSGYNSYKRWLPVIFKSFFVLFGRKMPEFLVLEYGVSDPGDMKYLLSIARPKISIITDISQRYLEAFSDMDELVGEYESFAGEADKAGIVVMNHDNRRLRSFQGIKARIESFGIEEGKWRAEIIEEGCGQKIRLNNMEYGISRPGRHHVYAFLAGSIVKNYVNPAKT